ncbi:MAG: protein kinase [Candidatus Aminicenantales bacterium]
MKCPKCSLQNSDTQKFCGDCGTSLSSDREGDVSRTTTIKLPAIPFPIGSTFAGRYQIIEELGKGGMGRVIRALDKKLDEEIAIKFIRSDLTEDPAAVERFRTELKAARQVIHKNVARMFDLNEADGVPFITMEYVRGGDLKSLVKKVGRLDAQQAVRIVRQVAEGLGEAHRTGVIHRDLKPHNIMVDEEGTARITDFGLARLRRADDATLTSPGMGTPAYASPEQVEGADVDNRSDLYSLGIVLYEMLTGKIPFKGDSPYSVALQRLTKAPPDPRSLQPDIPEALVHIIMKCLERERERRYQSAEELIIDLEAWEKEPSIWIGPKPQPPDSTGIRIGTWIRAKRIPLAFLAVVILSIAIYLIISPPSRTWKTSIAVLPVQDLSPPEGKENLWYGLQSDISAKLRSSPRLRVIPMYSLSEYDFSNKSFKEIGKELGAEYLMQLTIQTEGKRLQVRVDLIEAGTNSVVKPYKYHKELEDILTVQDEIVKLTANALKVDFVEERLSAIKKREPTNLEAYNYYLEGMRLIEKEYHIGYKPEVFAQAVGMYERAIAIDPNYALAYWGLGNAYEARYYNASKNPEDLEIMKNYYLQAHETGPDFAETNLGLGWMYFNMKENASASRQFKRALELDPNGYIVNQDVGAFLRSVGFYDKAVKYFSRAARIDPNSVSTRLLISSCLMNLGESEKAIQEVNEVIDQDPKRFEARYHCAHALIMMNRLNEAQSQIDIARQLDPKKELNLPQALLWAAEGEKENALATLSQLDENEALNLAATCAYIFLGMREKAIRTIEEGIENGFRLQGNYLYPYPMLAKNPAFKPLKDEPNFREILRKEKIKYRENIKKFARF